MSFNYLGLIGIALGVLCAAAIVIGRNRYRDLFAVFLVLGVLVLAVVVTIEQVDQYRAQRATGAGVPQVAESQPPAFAGSSTAPQPHPVIIPPPLGMRGPTGGAAPAAANPSAGGAH
ncbi:MAG: hypothetical protein ACM3JG_06670 [Thiohalocapsa sp.]